MVPLAPPGYAYGHVTSIPILFVYCAATNLSAGELYLVQIYTCRKHHLH